MIQETRLKMRLAIRQDQASAKDAIMAKLRQKIQAGYLPKTSEEFAGILKLVTEYAKSVGYAEECQEILEKLSEETPMTMEKLGVECKGDHGLAKPYMEKTASGDVSCRFCGAKFTGVAVQDGLGMKDKVGGNPKEIKGSIEKMLNMGG